jgi:RNA polymerase sigma-70 factor (ECF subfamily)
VIPFLNVSLKTIVSYQKFDISHVQHCISFNRDAQAYKALYINYYHSIITFAASIIGSKEGAEEVYSDVMMKVWNMGADFSKVDNVRVYLYAAVKNASLNYLAKYNKMKTVDIDSINLTSFSDDCTEKTVMEAELARSVNLAISTLPVKCQLVFRLIKEEGLSYKEVSKVLGISVNTIEGHMTNGLKKMHAALENFLSPQKN